MSMKYGVERAERIERVERNAEEIMKRNVPLSRLLLQ